MAFARYQSDRIKTESGAVLKQVAEGLQKKSELEIGDRWLHGFRRRRRTQYGSFEEARAGSGKSAFWRIIYGVCSAVKEAT
jgi:hypothetical protein